MAKHRSKHRLKRVRGLAKKASIAGSAVMTATALTLSIAPPAAAAAVVEDQNDAFDVRLAALSIPSIPDIPGVNVITTGPPFGLLGIVGLNPFWVPALPSTDSRRDQRHVVSGRRRPRHPCTGPESAIRPGLS